LNKHAFIDSACGYNTHFSDSGLFGLRVTGASDSAKKIYEEIVRELKDLTK